MRNILTIGICILTASCNATSGEKFSSSAARDIKTGVTNQKTVESLLGQPVQRTAMANGDETWIYDYSNIDSSDAGGRMAASSGMTAAGMIVGSMLPIPGLAMGAAAVGSYATMQGATTKNEKETLTITFKKGIVRSCMLQKLATSMSTSGGIIFMPPSIKQKSDSKEINCSDIAKSPEPQVATQAEQIPPQN